MSGKRILYIEDNLMNRVLVGRVLQVEGYTIIEAEDGASGIALAEKEKPDLILMDINLPDIDGYECTKRIRKNPDIKDVPIVALTANAIVGDKDKAIAAGCNGYISKPIDIDKLPEQVKEFLTSETKPEAVKIPETKPAEVKPPEKKTEDTKSPEKKIEDTKLPEKKTKDTDKDKP